jgi:predicted GNAT family acetyltransferase
MQVRTAGPADLLRRCAGLLAADPLTTNVVATAAAAEVRRGAVRSCFLWVERDGAPTAVAVLTPGFPFSLSRCTDAEAAALADALLERGCVVLGAGGPVTAARAFVRRWTARTGVPVTRVMRQGVYLCDEAVRPPVGVPGRSRPAHEADTSRVQQWLHDFAVEAGLGPAPPHGAAAMVAERRLHLWLDEDGRDVSMAAVRTSDIGLARLGPVWTPVADRRNGYASALTADLTAQLLAAGQRVMLFTDLDNPTSNGIYQAVGYRRVGDAVMVRF